MNEHLVTIRHADDRYGVGVPDRHEHLLNLARVQRIVLRLYDEPVHASESHHLRDSRTAQTQETADGRFAVLDVVEYPVVLHESVPAW